MAANLTPQYRRAEERYRLARSAAERLACLEEMLRLIPKHKGTDRLQGELRARIKETRAELDSEGSGSGARSFRIPRQGAATVVILGGPNSGKSRLLKELTNAAPVVAPYPFTTREPMAAIMEWRGFRIQLIDTPPVTEGHIDGYLVDFVRTADMVLLAFNGSSDDADRDTAAVISQFARRKTRLDRESGLLPDDPTAVCVRTLLAITRGDDPDLDLRLDLMPVEMDWSFPRVRVELERLADVEALRREIVSRLELIRIWTRRPGMEVNPAPVILRRGQTVADLADRLHEDLAAALKFAKVRRLEEPGERSVGRDFSLEDGDVVELHV